MTDDKPNGQEKTAEYPGLLGVASEEIEKIEIQKPLEGKQNYNCLDYAWLYASACDEAQKNGNAIDLQVFKFMNAVTGLFPKFDTPQDPYGPQFEFGDRRAAIVSDFSENDIAGIEQAIPLISDPAILARMHDILWLRRKNPDNAAAASKNYLEVAQSQVGEKITENLKNAARRSLHYAKLIGRGKPLFTETATEIEKMTFSAPDEAAVALLDVLYQYQLGDPEKCANLAESHVKDGDYLGFHRKLYEIAAEWYKRAGDDENEKRARIAAGEAIVREAEERSKMESTPFLAAAHILKEGIEALRRAGAETSRIEELRALLVEYQRKSQKEYETFETGLIDLSDAAKVAREVVESEDLFESIMRLSFSRPLTDPGKTMVSAKEDLDKYVSKTLFGRTMSDDSGRTTMSQIAWGDGDEETQKKRLEQEAFNYARTSWEFRAHAFIHPARQQIVSDHHPSFADLAFLVRNNPFVPPGHEDIFLKGIHAGFHGDFLTASLFLTPQIENSLRYVLESAGVPEVANLMSDGTEPVKMLGALLGLPATTEIFGETTVFELRGLLIEKTGYNFRHRVSHGFISGNECYSAAGMTTWWLVVRLCMTPFFHAKLQKQNQSVPDEETLTLDKE